MKETDSDRRKGARAYMVFSGIAFQMALMISGAALGGKYLDKQYDFEKPWFTIVFVLSTVLISMFLIIKKALDLSKDDESQNKKDDH